MKFGIKAGVAALTFLFASVANAAFIVSSYDTGSGSLTTYEDDVVNGTIAVAASGVYDVINFNDNGDNSDSGINFPGDVAFPGVPGDVGNNNFFVRALGGFFLNTETTFTFGARHDDGVRLLINGVQVFAFENNTNDRDTTGQITLQAGFNELDLRFFEASGGAHLELYTVLDDGQKVLFRTDDPLSARVSAPGALAILGGSILLVAARARAKK